MSRLRRRCERRLENNAIPSPSDPDVLCAVMAGHRGRPERKAETPASLIRARSAVGRPAEPRPGDTLARAADLLKFRS